MMDLLSSRPVQLGLHLADLHQVSSQAPVRHSCPALALAMLLGSMHMEAACQAAV